tara:strand:+ start:194 stop:661 length:468 start_codon:yes stop_codon:yes gene_type:complete
MVRETSYSLGNLEAALEDALSSDCTPEEIYETIRTTLRRNLTYHRVCVRTTNEVLRLVHGTENKDKVISLHERELDVTLTDFPDYTELPDVDRSFIDSERNNEENPMSYQDMIDAGYEMTGEGIWWPKDKEEETPDYNNPRVCAEIDSRGGDNRS